MSATVQDATTKTFDYVIVGGGAAGLTLAAELTEEPNISVLVLEAGPANLEDPNILRLASYGSHFANGEYAWAHTTAEQKYANNRSHSWHRGKGLGGSSAINFMCYTKPPAEDIDDIERLGNPGWNWERYQKALQRVEGFVAPSAEVKDKFKLQVDASEFGTEGPLKIIYPGMMHEAEIEVQQTLINAGLPIARRPMSGDPRGVFFIPNTHDPVTHTRSYATTAFYLSNRHRPNLSVLVDAYAHRVRTEKLHDGELKATGVEFLYGGKTYTARASSEVILSAGSCRSPQLLELSGIGRKDVLEKIGVPLKLELPGVGENLQEHMMAPVIWELKDEVKYDTLELLRDPEVFKKNLELHAQGLGLFTMGITAFAFVHPDTFSPKAEELYKKAQEIYSKVDAKENPGLKEMYKIQMERLEPGKGGAGCEFVIAPLGLPPTANAEPGKRHVSVSSVVNHNWSRGTVHCVTNDPMQDPAMDPRYFEQDIDLDIFTEGMKFLRKLANVSPLKDMIVNEVVPGPEVTTDEQLKDWLKDNLSTTWHTAGSCSMLPRESGGVVDPSLKVYGTANLRVVDLSILPLHIAAHTLATVYSFAAQAADIIKAERKAGIAA